SPTRRASDLSTATGLSGGGCVEEARHRLNDLLDGVTCHRKEAHALCCLRGAKRRRSAQLTRRPAQKRHLFVSSACQSTDTAHRLLKFGGRPHAKADETASRGEHARDGRSILRQGLAELLDFFLMLGVLSFDGVQRFTAG